MKEWLLPIIGSAYLTLLGVACNPEGKIDGYPTPFPRVIIPTPPPTEIPLSQEEVVRGFVEALARNDLQKAASFISPDSINKPDTRRRMDFLSTAMKGCSIEDILKLPTLKTTQYYSVGFKNRCNGNDLVEINMNLIGDKYYIDPLSVFPMHVDFFPSPSTPTPSRLP